MVYVQNIPALPQISKEMTEAGQYDLIFTTAGVGKTDHLQMFNLKGTSAD